jgi:hypothetical protein
MPPIKSKGRLVRHTRRPFSIRPKHPPLSSFLRRCVNVTPPLLRGLHVVLESRPPGRMQDEGEGIHQARASSVVSRRLWEPATEPTRAEAQALRASHGEGLSVRPRCRQLGGTPRAARARAPGIRKRCRFPRAGAKRGTQVCHHLLVIRILVLAELRRLPG